MVFMGVCFARGLLQASNSLFLCIKIACSINPFFTVIILSIFMTFLPICPSIVDFFAFQFDQLRPRLLWFELFEFFHDFLQPDTKEAYFFSLVIKFAYFFKLKFFS